jgi:hypothetical protein
MVLCSRINASRTMTFKRALFEGAAPATQRCTAGQLPRPVQLRFHTPSLPIIPVSLRTFHSHETAFNSSRSLKSRFQDLERLVVSLEELVKALETPLQVSRKEGVQILEKLVVCSEHNVRAIERLVGLEIASQLMTERKQRSPHCLTPFEKVMCALIMASTLGLFGVMACDIFDRTWKQYKRLSAGEGN